MCGDSAMRGQGTREQLRQVVGRVPGASVVGRRQRRRGVDAPGVAVGARRMAALHVGLVGGVGLRAAALVPQPPQPVRVEPHTGLR